MPLPARRGPWSSHEDQHLLNLVQAHGAQNWVRISHLVGSRSPKQCRERYHQNLKPSLNHEPITDEEGRLITQLVGEIGKKWAEIARRLDGRSDNAVKNWWNGGQNRKKRGSRSGRSMSGGFHLPSPYARHPNLHIDVSGGDSDDGLASPAYSEYSRGQTPSLVSDSTSIHSSSPLLSAPCTPCENTLPPLRLPGDSPACRRHSISNGQIFYGRQALDTIPTGFGLNSYALKRPQDYDSARYMPDYTSTQEVFGNNSNYHYLRHSQSVEAGSSGARSRAMEVGPPNLKDARMDVANILS